MYFFKRKIISLMLIFSMILSMIPTSTFAANNEIIVHSGETITGDYAGSSNIISKVSVENIDSADQLKVGVKDPDIIVTTDSQTSIIGSSNNGRYMGRDLKGVPLYIYSINLDIPLVEKDSHYEYSFKDKLNHTISNVPAYSPIYVFNPTGSLYINECNVKEISESFAGESLPISFFILSPNSNVNKRNSTLRLLENGVEVAKMDSSEIAVCYSKKGEAQLAGNFTLPSSLDSTKEYNWEISMPEENGNTGSSTFPLKVFNSENPSFADMSIDGTITSSHMEFHQGFEESSSLPPIFAGKNIDSLNIYIDRISGISDSNKIKTIVKQDSNILSTINGINLTPEEYGISSGSLEIPLNAVLNNEDLLKLEFYYDNQTEPFYKRDIKITDLKGIEYGSCKTSGSKNFKVVIDNPLNIDIENLSVYINGDLVSINNRNEYSNSYWELECSSSLVLKNYDKVTLKENKNDVYMLYLNGGYNGEPYSLGGDYPVQIDLSAFLGEHISRGTISENDYLFEGSDFNGDNYTVELFKMPIESMDFSVTTSALTKIDSNLLKLESNEFSSMEKGWYGGTVKNNGVPVNGGFVDNISLPIAIDNISNEIDYPKVTLNNNISSTTSREIEISVYKGDYDSFRYSENEESLASASWNDIITPFTYTLSEDFGQKTIFFEFKKSELSNYSIQKTISYVDKDLSNIKNYGVNGLVTSGENEIIPTGKNVTIWFESGDKFGSGKITFLDENKNSLYDSITMRPNSIVEDIATYTYTINFTSTEKNIKFIRLDSISSSGEYSPPVEIPVKINDILNIYSATCSMPTVIIENEPHVYSYGTIRLIADVSFKDSVAELKAILTYIDKNDAEKTYETTLAKSYFMNYYQKNMLIPNDAKKLISVKFLAENATAKSNEIVKEINASIMGKASFIEFEKYSLFNSATLKIIGENQYETSSYIYSNSKTFDLPEGNYSYSISDGYMSYAEGVFSINSGETKSISLKDVKEPVSLIFNVTSDSTSSDLPYYVNNEIKYGMPVKVTRNGAEAYYNSNTSSRGFYKDEVIDYEFELADYMKKWVKTPDKVTNYTINGDTIDVVLETYKISELSGYVKNSNGDPMANVRINISQEITNGNETFSYYDYTSTDSSGKYTLKKYDGFSGTIKSSNYGYDEISESFKAKESAHDDIVMIYNPSNAISLSSSIHRTGSSDSSLSSDLSIIKYIYVYDNPEVYGYLDLQNKMFRIYGSNTKNTTIKLDVSFTDSYYGKETYEVQLDENGRGSSIIECSELGYPEINYYNGDKGSSLMTYGLIYNDEGERISILTGQDFLSNPQSRLEEGKYILVLMTTYDVDFESILANIDYFSFYPNLQKNKNYLSKDFNIENGEITTLDFYEKLEPVSKDELQKGSPRMTADFRLDKSGRAIFDVTAKIAFNNSGNDRFALNNLLLKSQGQLDGPVYINGSTVNVTNTTGGGGTLFQVLHYNIPEEVENGDPMTLNFSVIMDITETSNMNLEYSYLKNSTETFRGALSLTDIETPAISLTVPSQTLSGDESSNVYVKGIGIPGKTVEIYDNGDIIAKETVKANSSWESYISLINPEIPAVHSLTAKLYDGETVYDSDIQICEIINKETTPYVYDFNLQNYQGFHIDSLSESTDSKLFAYNPYRHTKVWFKIANIDPDDLSSVKLCFTKEGETRYFEAEYQDDSSDRYKGYWYIYKVLGDPGKISVEYTIRDEVSIGKLTGSENTIYDVDKILESGIDESKFPEEIQTLINTETISNNVTKDTKTQFNQRVDIGSGFSLDYNITSTVKDKDSIDVSKMTKYQTSHGDFWMNLPTMNSSDVSMKMKIIYSKELSAYLGLNTSKEQEISYIRSLNPVPGLFSRPSMSVSGDDVVNTVDMTCNVLSGGEIVQTLATGEEFTKLTGNTLNVIGGATTMYTLATAKLGKDGSSLKGLLDSIKYDSRAWTNKGGSAAFYAERTRIAKDILEYKSTNRNSVIIKKIFAVSGFIADKTKYIGGPLSKGLSLGISAGGMAFDTVSQEYDIWWQGIVDSIGALRSRNTAHVCPDCGFVDCVCINKKWVTCTGCGAKFKHGTPHKCGHKSKKDDVNDPKWKIDPSGYVYETYNDNRLEGITATALYNYGTKENPVFSTWAEASEWGETNPQSTDSDGKYGWDVPMGQWKVLFEDKSDSSKYLNTTTKSMDVPPVHDQVNIGLLSTEIPTVKSVGINPEFAEVEFSMYIQPKTLESNIIISNSDGDLVPIKEISLVNPIENKGYTENDPYNTNIINSDSFTKKINIIPDTDKYSGGFRIYKNDGTTKETYTISLSENIKSYANVDMTKYEGEFNSYDKEKVLAVTSDIPSGEYSEIKTVTLETATVSTSGAATSIYYTTDGSAPTINSRFYSAPLTIDKDTIIKSIATKPGMENSDTSTFEYKISIGKIVSSKDTVYAPSNNDHDSDDDDRRKDSSGNSGNSVNPGVPGNQLPDSEKLDQSGKREIYIPTKEEREKAIESFTDAKDHWAKDSIGFVTAKGLFKGVSEKEFAPDTAMTRGMFVTVLGRLAEANTDDYKLNFGDVESKEWYAGSIAWATENKIVNGVGNNNFAPNDDITREQLCVMIYNYIKFTNLQLPEVTDKENFGDIENVSNWAKEAVIKVQRLGLVNGKDGNIFDPFGKATRGEVATILERFVELLAKQQTT